MGYTPPEGGWGWAVVIGAFISIGFSYAFPKSITVFFKEIEVIFNASSSKVSWISSIMLAVMYAGGKWMEAEVCVLVRCSTGCSSPTGSDLHLTVVTATKTLPKVEILSLRANKTSLSKFA